MSPFRSSMRLSGPQPRRNLLDLVLGVRLHRLWNSSTPVGPDETLSVTVRGHSKVATARVRGMEGAITISMEIELGWRVHDVAKSSHLSEDDTAERAYLDRLLDHCDDLNLPITFESSGTCWRATATVGTTAPTARAGSTATQRQTRPPTPVLRRSENRGAADHHERCSHTYTHVPCAETTPEAVAWEHETAQT